MVDPVILSSSWVPIVEVLDLLRELKDWVLGFADSDWSAVALALNSFTESVFFPIPPDVLKKAGEEVASADKALGEHRFKAAEARYRQALALLKDVHGPNRHRRRAERRNTRRGARRGSGRARGPVR